MGKVLYLVILVGLLHSTRRTVLGFIQDIVVEDVRVDVLAFRSRNLLDFSKNLEGLLDLPFSNVRTNSIDLDVPARISVLFLILLLLLDFHVC